MCGAGCRAGDDATSPPADEANFSRRELLGKRPVVDTDPSRWHAGGVRFGNLPPAYRGDVNTSAVPYDRQPGVAPALDDGEIDDIVAFLRTLTDE